MPWHTSEIFDVLWLCLQWHRCVVDVVVLCICIIALSMLCLFAFVSLNCLCHNVVLVYLAPISMISVGSIGSG